MLGFYLFAAVLGGGLLAFSTFGGGDADADIDADYGDGSSAGAFELILGFFRLRNLIFFLAAFGVTGTVLTWLSRSSGLTLALALAMGSVAMVASHAVFSWLRKSNTAVALPDDSDLIGTSGRVVLTVAPGQRGRVVCTVGGREQYITARLTARATAAAPAGAEIVVVGVENGVAEIALFDSLPDPTPTA